MCQHSSPRGSDLSDLRASWHLPLDRSQIFTGARLFIDSVFSDWPMSISFPRSPEVLARLCFPRALAAFSFFPPQHPAHFLPLQLLALLVFFGGRGRGVSVCMYFFFFFFKKKNPNEFVLQLLKKKRSVIQDFSPIHSISTSLSVSSVVFKSQNWCGFHRCLRNVVLELCSASTRRELTKRKTTADAIADVA